MRVISFNKVDLVYIFRPEYTSSLTAFLVKHLSSFPPWLKIVATVQTPLQKVATQLPFQRIR